MFNKKRDKEERRSHEEFVKDRDRRRNVFPWILGTFLVIIVGVSLIALWLGFNHSYFNVDRVDIVGNRLLSDEEFVKELGLTGGQNIFKLKTAEIESKTMEIVGVQEAKAKKILPDQLIINVVEDIDLGFVTVENGFLLVKGDLTVDRFEEKLSPENQKDLIKIIGADYTDLTVGSTISEDRGQLELLRNITDHQLYKITREIDFGKKNGKTHVILDSGTVVELGDLKETDYKLSIVEKIVEDLNKQDIVAKEIILNQGTNPIVVIED